MHRKSILLLLCALISLALAASPPSFCKCTCSGNSTIVDLDAHSAPDDEDSPSTGLFLFHREIFRRVGNGGASCNKCNRVFCRNQGIDACKKAADKDVFTTCFQRDSRKDQIIVLLFIAVTVGLLSWAGVRKILEKRGIGRRSVAESLGRYVPVSGR